MGLGYGPDQAPNCAEMAHLHFSLGLGLLDSQQVLLSDVLGVAGEELFYVYDFGDFFTFMIKVEEVVNVSEVGGR
jgi:hypothetical protein